MTEDVGTDLSAENVAFVAKLKRQQEESKTDPEYLVREAARQRRHEAEQVDNQARVDAGEIKKAPSIDALRDAIKNS